MEMATPLRRPGVLHRIGKVSMAALFLIASACASHADEAPQGSKAHLNGVWDEVRPLARAGETQKFDDPVYFKRESRFVLERCETGTCHYRVVSAHALWPEGAWVGMKLYRIDPLPAQLADVLPKDRGVKLPEAGHVLAGLLVDEKLGLHVVFMYELDKQNSKDRCFPKKDMCALLEAYSISGINERDSTAASTSEGQPRGLASRSGIFSGILGFADFRILHGGSAHSGGDSTGR